MKVRNLATELLMGKRHMVMKDLERLMEQSVLRGRIAELRDYPSTEGQLSRQDRIEALQEELQRF